MKKMNRSQSSYRNCKTLINDQDQDNWMSKYASRHNNSKNQINVTSSFLDPNKENNSLYQSISEREFHIKVRDSPVEHDPTPEIVKKLEMKCRKQEEQLKMLYKERDQFMRDMSSSDQSKTYNYCERSYLSEIQKMKSLIMQKDRELEQFKQEYSTRNEEMDSLSSEMSSKMEKDQRDKNLYIKEINNKAIQISHLQERVKIHRAEIETLKLYINEKDKNIKELEDRIGQIDMKKKKIQHYEYQIKQSNEFLKELQSRTHKLKEEMEQKDVIIFDKTKSIVQLEQTIGSYEDKLHSIEDALIKLKEDRKVTLQKNQQLMRQCEDWKITYDQLLKKSECIQQNQIKIKTYIGMMENLNKKNMDLTSANQKYKISISTFEKNFTKYQEMEKDIINLRKDLKDKEQKIAELQAKQKSHKHLQDCYTKVRKQKDEFFIKIQQRNKQNKQLTLQLDEYRNRMLSLQEQIRQIEENNHRTKERGEKMDILMKENNRLNTAILQKMTEIERLQIRINNLDNKITEKSNETIKMKDIIDERQQEIHQITLQVQDLRERYEFETNNRIMNEDKVLRCNQEIYVQQCTINKLEMDNQQMEEKINLLTAQYDTEIKELKELVAEMESSKQQTECLLLDSKTKILTLRGEAEECKRQIEESMKKQKEHRNKIAVIEDQLIKLKEENRVLRQQKTQIIEKCEQLKGIYEFVMRYKEKKSQN